MNDYRECLIAQLKAAAKDLYEHPEQFVPEKCYNTSFDIWIKFPGNNYDPPTIEVTAEYFPDKVFECMSEEDAKKYSSDDFFGRN